MVQLKLDGKPFIVKAPSPAVQRLIAFLDSAPVDDLFTNVELEGKIRVTSSWIKNTIPRCRELDEYSVKVGIRRLYGNPKAILELKKQLG